MSQRSLVVQIEPAVIKYARYCSGYSVAEVAKKLSIKEEVLVKYEEVKAEISIPRLEKIANIYKMPLAYFFLQQVPKDVILPKDFRIVYSSEKTSFPPKVMLAVRRARYVQSVIQELIGKEVNHDFKKISLQDDVDEVASRFRVLLGISVKDQFGWLSPSDSLRHWKNAIEKMKIFVLQESLTGEEISAFCLADAKPFVLLLNSSEHENRRIFSLFHEICHLLLHRSGICTPDNLSRNSTQYIEIERFCNQFSASVLIPRNDLLNNPIAVKLSRTPFGEWGFEDVKTISKQFHVSQEAIYRRFVTLGILDEDEYELKREELMKGFEDYKKKGKVNKKFIIPQYRKIISKNGYAYSSFILDNLHSNRITIVEAADYLNTNSRHISAVEYHL